MRVAREVLEVKLLMIRVARGLEVNLDLELVLLIQKMLEWRLALFWCTLSRRFDAMHGVVSNA